VELLKAASYPGAEDIIGGEGVVTSADTKVASLASDFIKAIAQHRFWSRELKAMPA
jgi:catalase